VDEENWKCFVNSTLNPETNELEFKKVELINIIPE
jgi:adenylylsulfate reductase subunit A